MLISVIAAALSLSAPHALKPAPVFVVRAKDFSFVAPAEIKSGPTTFKLVNEGKELHHLTLVKLDSGKTMKDFSEAMQKPGPFPAWTSFVGGPNPAAPGKSVEATLTLEPGQYVMLCFINSPGDPKPHMAKGMVRPLTVLPAANGRTARAADDTVRLSDYSFTFSKPLTAGSHVVHVVNGATQPHEIVLAMLPKGKTIADLAKYVDEDLMKGPPPAMPVGGLATISPGRTATFNITLPPGRYGAICFVPDAKDGKPHSAHGMTTEFTVK